MEDIQMTVEEVQEAELSGVSLVKSLKEARGMTIVELMIVLTIIASIMGVVGFFVFGTLDKANIKESQIEIAQLTSMVEAFYLSASPRAFPNDLEEMTKGASPLTKEIPRDPWGNDYVYKKTSGREFEIYSAGPDGIEGNEDDVRADGVSED